MPLQRGTLSLHFCVSSPQPLSDDSEIQLGLLISHIYRRKIKKEKTLSQIRMTVLECLSLRLLLAVVEALEPVVVEEESSVVQLRCNLARRTMNKGATSAFDDSE